MMVPTWVRPWLAVAVLIFVPFHLYSSWTAIGARAWQASEAHLLERELRPPLEWFTLDATRAGSESLLTLASKGRDPEVEACSEAGKCRDTCLSAGRIEAGADAPVFNCLIPPADEAKPPARIRGGVSYLMRSDGERVEVVALAMGDITGVGCGEGGRCYLFGDMNGRRGLTGFVSDDAGLHWRWIPMHGLGVSYGAEVLNVEGDRAWLVSEGSVYFTEDGGRQWREIASERTLVDHRPRVGDDALYEGYIVDPTQWALDETGTLYGYRDDIDSASMVLFQLDALSGDILSVDIHSGRLESIVGNPETGVFAIHRDAPLTRYSLVRLSGGEWLKRLETGPAPLSNLHASGDTLLMSRDRGDRVHTALSRDGGASFVPMQSQMLYDRAIFDPATGNILRMGQSDGAGHVDYRWMRP